METKIFHSITMYRVYNITNGLFQAFFEEEFTSKQAAYQWITKQSKKKYFMVVECIPGDAE